MTYLRRTKDMFLVFGGLDGMLDVKCYTDTGFQTDQDDTKSQSGYIFIMNGGVVAWRYSDNTPWKSFRNLNVSEVEPVAYWITKFIGELGAVPSNGNPMKMYCDNSSAIPLANDVIVCGGS